MIDDSARLTQHEWGGPPENYAVEDQSTGRVIYLKVNFQGNIVLATDVEVYVLNEREFLSTVDNLRRDIAGFTSTLTFQSTEDEEAYSE